MPEPRELLLVLDARRPSADVLRQYRITQQASPRVMLVEGRDDSTKEALQTLAGVQAVLEPGETLSKDLRKELGDAELIFVDAHAQRSRPKKRRGEGLDWDAEGFLPP
jgi:5S rRNA maturation endonuclease (ribonuclease M5)